MLIQAMQRREARAASEKHRLDAENAINRLKVCCICCKVLFVQINDDCKLQEHEEEIKRIEEEQAAFEATYANEEKVNICFLFEFWFDF